MNTQRIRAVLKSVVTAKGFSGQLLSLVVMDDRGCDLQRAWLAESVAYKGRGLQRVWLTEGVAYRENG